MRLAFFSLVGVVDCFSLQTEKQKTLRLLPEHEERLRRMDNPQGFRQGDSRNEYKKHPSHAPTMNGLRS